MAKKSKPAPELDEVIEPTEELDEDVAVEPDTEVVETEVTAPVVEPKSASKSSGKKSSSRASKKAAAPSDTSLAPDAGTVSAPPQSKRKLALILSIIGVLLIGASAAGFMLLGPDSTSNSNSTNSETTTNSEDRVARKIDGVIGAADQQNLYPIAVMVENHSLARPQGGLDEANIVYEALAEGGITRFLAIFTLTREIDEIGPVRSVRPYYAEWAAGYNALFVHAGGSPKGLARVTSLSLPVLNQFFSSQYFFRDRSRKVSAEHTLFTTSTLLARALIDKKMPEQGDYDAWSYKSEAPASERPASQKITIDFSSFSYKVGYEYDPGTNTYQRLQAEKPHVVRNGARITPKNVVVIRVKRSLEEPRDGEGRLTLETVGSGQATFFVDGRETQGTWKKTSAQSSLELLGPDGEPFPLNAGQTWVEVVPPEQPVTVS